MRSYHQAWLAAHPERSAEWLKRMLNEGFDVHHVDGDHSNDHPGNLVLLEAVDHLRLHGMFGLVKLGLHKTSQRKGGTNRWAGKTKAEKSAHMRMMVMAREKKRRDKAAHRRRAKSRQREKAAKVAAEVTL